MARTRRGRKFWAKLIDDYEAAGAGERHQAFADRHGVECDTFRRWLYLFRAERRGRRWQPGKGSVPAPAIALPLVELQPVSVADARFEVELRDGVRIHVPSAFGAESLRRLLAVLVDKP
jgi:transposase-like protein